MVDDFAIRRRGVLAAGAGALASIAAPRSGRAGCRIDQDRRCVRTERALCLVWRVRQAGAGDGGREVWSDRRRSAIRILVPRRAVRSTSDDLRLYRARGERQGQLYHRPDRQPRGWRGHPRMAAIQADLAGAGQFEHVAGTASRQRAEFLPHLSLRLPYINSSCAAALKHYLGAGKTMAILYTDDDYGETHVPFARQYYSEAGINIVATEKVRGRSRSTWDRRSAGSVAHGPDILLGLVQTTDQITLTKQVQSHRLEIPYLIGTASTQLKEWQDAVGSAQEGWLGITTYLPGVNWPASPTYPDLFPTTEQWRGGIRRSL